MKTVKVKTSELEGAALDWAVAMAKGLQITDIAYWHVNGKENPVLKTGMYDFWRPSNSWSQLGPLIEKYKVWLSPAIVEPNPDDSFFGWDADVYDDADIYIVGRGIWCKTPLIAACRAIVASQLGDEVEVPEELL